jgi:hypothetical protein
MTAWRFTPNRRLPDLCDSPADAARHAAGCPLLGRARPYHYVRHRARRPITSCRRRGSQEQRADDAEIRYGRLRPVATCARSGWRDAPLVGQVLDTIDYASFSGHPGNANVYVHTGDPA